MNLTILLFWVYNFLFSWNEGPANSLSISYFSFVRNKAALLSYIIVCKIFFISLFGYASVLLFVFLWTKYHYCFYDSHQLRIFYTTFWQISYVNFVLSTVSWEILQDYIEFKSLRICNELYLSNICCCSYKYDSGDNICDGYTIEVTSQIILFLSKNAWSSSCIFPFFKWLDKLFLYWNLEWRSCL